MSEFIASPLIENWAVKNVPESSFLICSPYIKADALGALLSTYEMYPVNKKNISICIITRGSPDTYWRGSSDIEIIKLLSSITNVSIYLVDNLHMKAYLVDDKSLLVTSGNCTCPGLFPGGNVEGGIETKDIKEISDIKSYIKDMCLVARQLKTPIEMNNYFNEINDFIIANKADIESEKEARKEMAKKKSAYTGHRYSVKSKGIAKHIKSPKYEIKNKNSLRQYIAVYSSLSLKDLTNEKAYFLGGLFISDRKEYAIDGNNFICSTTRYNSRPKDPDFESLLTEHRNSIIDLVGEFCSSIKCGLADEVDKDRFGFKSMVGFATLFHPDEVPNNMDLFSYFLDSSTDINFVRSFLVGMFDSRGYVDKTYKLMDLDINDDVTMNQIKKLLKTRFSIESKYNPPRERETGSGTERRAQLRVNLSDFFEKIGCISPNRVKAAHAAIGKGTISADPILNGCKVIQ